MYYRDESKNATVRAFEEACIREALSQNRPPEEKKRDGAACACQNRSEPRREETGGSAVGSRDGGQSGVGSEPARADPCSDGTLLLLLLVLALSGKDDDVLPAILAVLLLSGLR